MGKWRLPLAEVPDLSAAEPLCDSAPSDHSAWPQALQPYPRAFRGSDGRALGHLLFGKKGIDGCPGLLLNLVSPILKGMTVAIW